MTTASPRNSRHVESHPIPAFSELGSAAVALSAGVRAQSIESLNQPLADTLVLRDLYRKHYR